MKRRAICLILFAATPSVAAAQQSPPRQPKIIVQVSHWGLGSTCDNTQVIARLCNGRTQCTIDAMMPNMCPGGTDPAPGHLKILETLYACSQDASGRVVKTLRFHSAPNILAKLSCP